jgi:hypothetical protein
MISGPRTLLERNGGNKSRRFYYLYRVVATFKSPFRPVIVVLPQFGDRCYPPKKSEFNQP